MQHSSGDYVLFVPADVLKIATYDNAGSSDESGAGTDELATRLWTGPPEKSMFFPRQDMKFLFYTASSPA